MIKVVVVDDSAVVRQLLTKNLQNYEDISVEASASDPYAARDLIVKLKPDVITLDIEMPRMDGLTFLRKLMNYYPLPVVIVSSVTTKDASAAVRALEEGAFDVVNKPGGSISVEEVVDEVAYKIRQAYKVRKSFISRRQIVKLGGPKKPLVTVGLSQVQTTRVFIVIGSSTGGTVALENLFTRLPANMPPILVVQHMPENYTYQFAKRLDSLSELKIKESTTGEIIQSGHVYIARGGVHMRLKRKGTSMVITHDRDERVSYQRPSVDVLFESMAQQAGSNVLALILTGMGSDGAEGMLKLKNAGAATIAQNEATSVVYGMPQAAVKNGSAQRVMALDEMPQAMINFAVKHKDL